MKLLHARHWATPWQVAAHRTCPKTLSNELSHRRGHQPVYLRRVSWDTCGTARRNPKSKMKCENSHGNLTDRKTTSKLFITIDFDNVSLKPARSSFTLSSSAVRANVSWSLWLQVSWQKVPHEESSQAKNQITAIEEVSGCGHGTAAPSRCWKSWTGRSNSWQGPEPSSVP